VPILDADADAPSQAVEPASAPAAEPEPLEPDVEPGRAEARAAFVADAGPDTSGDSPRVVVTRESPDAAPVADYPAREVARLCTRLLDMVGQGVGPRLGGTRAEWALTEAESDAISTAAEPVIDAYGLTRLSPEWALVATVAAVYLPRVASVMEARTRAVEARADATT